MPDVSIVIPCHNEGQHLYDTLDSIRETTHDIDYEIIVVNDGSTDRDYSDAQNERASVFTIQRRGIAGAMNFGARRARGNVLVFMDGHMTLEAGWLSRLIDTLDATGAGIVTPVICDSANPALKGYGCSTNILMSMIWLGKQRDEPYEVPVLPGAVKVMKKSFFDRIGAFDSGLRQWAPLDIELSFRTWLFGHSIILDPTVEAGHVFRQSFPYDVDPVVYDANVIRVAMSHFSDARLNATLAALAGRETFSLSYLSAISGGALGRRYSFFMRRKHDDDWFFGKFGISG